MTYQDLTPGTINSCPVISDAISSITKVLLQSGGWRCSFCVGGRICVPQIFELLNQDETADSYAV